MKYVTLVTESESAAILHHEEHATFGQAMDRVRSLYYKDDEFKTDVTVGDASICLVIRKETADGE
jgi:hypothetical protein